MYKQLREYLTELSFLRYQILNPKFTLYVFLTIFLFILIPSFGAGQDLLMPENPLKGRFLFEQKGCINCHAIKGEGGKVGPDLGFQKYYGSFLQLASIMWNHSPEMLKRMRELDLPYPKFSRNEMVELIAYLYYLRYLGEPGDLYRGKILLEEKKCLTCHSVGGKGGKSAPAFDKLSKYVSPLYLVQAMWNHGPDMDKEIKKKGLQRPKFAQGEMVDLSAYIREASKGGERERVYMSPGNPQTGKQIFKDKGCFNCHTIDGKGKNIGPDLSELKWDYSVTEIAGLMWNHALEMGNLMQGKKMDWPKFTGKEMADLIAYLYFLKFKDKPGDQNEGKMVFFEKGCVNCHDHNINEKENKIAKKFINSSSLTSSIDMAQIMWNHAPVMEENIAEKIIQWPKLSGKEMADLYAYLCALLKHDEKKNNK